MLYKFDNIHKKEYHRAMIDKNLAKIGLRDQEIKAFLFLLENGGQPVGIIAKKTGIARPSLYGFLKKLQEKGLITESQKDGLKSFSISSENKIDLILNEQIKEIEETKSFFQKAFKEIQKGNLPTISPRLQLFEGKKELQFILKDMLLYKNMETKAYWPIKSMIEVLGEDFFKYFNKERIKNNIYTRAIWPKKQVVDIKKYPYLGVGEDFLREIRIAPKEIDFSMGYWVYEDKVAFISSKKETFGFILLGKEFAQMLSSQFEVIWRSSKEIKVNPKDTESFLKEIRL